MRLSNYDDSMLFNELRTSHWMQSGFHPLKPMYLTDGYRPPRGLTGWYRYLLVREAKRQMYGNTLYFIDRHSGVRECRVMGRPKTWKTRPGCVLSLRYGMRENCRVGDSFCPEDRRLTGSYGEVHVIVPVKQAFDPFTPPDIILDWVQEHELVY